MKKYTFIYSIILIISTKALANASEQIGSLDEGKTRFKEITTWIKNHPNTPPPLTAEEEFLIFGKDNLPKPGSGVKILPAEKMHYTKEQLSALKARLKQAENSGYIDNYNNKAATLLRFHEIAKADFSATSGPIENNNSHLRRNISELHIAYDFVGVPSNLVKEVIAFAPLSTYSNSGWAGAVEFFVPKNINSICSLEEINIKLTGSSMHIAQEVARYDVNDKITTIETSGNNASGFNCEIEWWDSNFRHVLSCATNTYTSGYSDKILKMAQHIDSVRN